MQTDKTIQTDQTDKTIKDICRQRQRRPGRHPVPWLLVTELVHLVQPLAARQPGCPHHYSLVLFTAGRMSRPRPYFGNRISECCYRRVPCRRSADGQTDRIFMNRYLQGWFSLTGHQALAQSSPLSKRYLSVSVTCLPALGN
ncbi:unnamed protein product [Nezara viridula]|uniref:Uncharacterized protein n=1 Tax=Nezara viridula TaxID=85310 RepID=A0A9P0E8Q0_NEZVI|nr:unnamed protein product [Nezara viridula]